MGFIKVVKNKSYFARYQVKYRRRREGKTDYYARRRLIQQDKNKYNSPKYRLVVRTTNKDVVAQIIYATIKGDIVLSAAYAHELPRYGITLGLTNYAATYATGLLLARRTLAKLKLADKYVGNNKIDGSDYSVEPLLDGPRPFRAYLDVGLKRTTTGARVFAALKGALDGGLDIPHSDSRFVGYDREAKSLKAEILRKYIYGGHVAQYMRHLQKEDEDAYKTQFSRYIKAGLTADKIEKVYENAFKAIRANPAFVKSNKPQPKKHSKPALQKRLTLAERNERIKQKKASLGGDE